MSGFYIHDSMLVGGLDLKGCDLLIFAIVHSYTAAGKETYSISSISERLGYDRSHVARVLGKLEREGFVICTALPETPGKEKRYKVSPATLKKMAAMACEKKSQCDATNSRIPVWHNLTSPCEKMPPDNKEDRKDDNYLKIKANGQHRKTDRKCVADVPSEFSGSSTIEADW